MTWMMYVCMLYIPLFSRVMAVCNWRGVFRVEVRGVSEVRQLSVMLNSCNVPRERNMSHPLLVRHDKYDACAVMYAENP